MIVMSLQICDMYVNKISDIQAGVADERRADNIKIIELQICKNDRVQLFKPSLV